VRLSSRNAWADYFRRGNGNPAQEYQFYQAVDKLEREDPAISEQKLSALGFTYIGVKEFITLSEPTPELQFILDDLEARGLRSFVKLDYAVIRGLAYYTGPVFEAFDAKGELRAIAGGGRYDNLIKLISGGKVDLPSLGFGMGDVVLLELLKSRKLLPAFTAGIEAFVMIEDETLRSQSLRLVQTLRETGLAVDYALTAAKGDKQFKRAQELKAGWLAKLERAADGTVGMRLRNLKTREETTGPVDEVVARLK
jgi:histidyl-tRNA synthetase